VDTAAVPSAATATNIPFPKPTPCNVLLIGEGRVVQFTCPRAGPAATIPLNATHVTHTRTHPHPGKIRFMPQT
jgi:hypothetical protein